MDSVAMGLSLAPVIANFNMSFEQQAISLVAKRPAHWYRYVDDTFVVWRHGKDEELQGFLQHLNSSTPICSQWKCNKTRHVIPRCPGQQETRGYAVYKKSTHIVLYLHMRS
jgi:hypothetical protein